MKKVELIEEYNTSFGKTFVIKNNQLLKVGDEISINGNSHTIKQIIFPTRPLKEGMVSVIV